MHPPITTAYVYSGPGTSKRAVTELCRAIADTRCYDAVAPISSQELKKGKWRCDARLLAIPGGRDIPYVEALSGVGNALIKEWVVNGGAFLGICAGAYYGAAAVEFEVGTALEVTGARELAFFPGIARGPAYGKGRFSYNSSRGASISQLQWQLPEAPLPTPLLTYFNGGCSFVDANNYGNSRALALYGDIADLPAAIVECQVGQGMAILSGVHPEYRHAVVATPWCEELRVGLGGCRQLFTALINRLIL